MRQLFYVLLISSLTGCSKKIMSTSDRLESVGFFDLMEDKNKINGYKRVIDQQFKETNWLTFPNNRYLSRLLQVEIDNSISTSDWRTIEIYGNDMFEGNFKSYLEDISLIFERSGLKLLLGEEKMNWGDKKKGIHQFDHSIDINESYYEVFSGNLKDRSINHPKIYVERTLEILNEELLKQGSSNSFALVTHTECVYFVFSTPEIKAILRDICEQSENELIITKHNN